MRKWFRGLFILKLFKDFKWLMNINPINIYCTKKIEKVLQIVKSFGIDLHNSFKKKSFFKAQLYIFQNQVLKCLNSCLVEMDNLQFDFEMNWIWSQTLCRPNNLYKNSNFFALTNNMTLQKKLYLPTTKTFGT